MWEILNLSGVCVYMIFIIKIKWKLNWECNQMLDKAKGRFTELLDRSEDSIQIMNKT